MQILRDAAAQQKLRRTRPDEVLREKRGTSGTEEEGRERVEPGARVWGAWGLGEVCSVGYGSGGRERWRGFRRRVAHSWLFSLLFFFLLHMRIQCGIARRNPFQMRYFGLFESHFTKRKIYEDAKVCLIWPTIWWLFDPIFGIFRKFHCYFSLKIVGKMHIFHVLLIL